MIYCENSVIEVTNPNFYDETNTRNWCWILEARVKQWDSWGKREKEKNNTEEMLGRKQTDVRENEYFISNWNGSRRRYKSMNGNRRE
jgi:hypothetical protein